MEAEMAQEKWLVDGPKTIDIDSARTLKVGLIGGQIDIVAHDEPGVRVEVHSVSGKSLKVSVDGDTVEIDHPQLGWDNWFDVFTTWTGKARADVSVMVPRDIRIKLGVVSATALVTGVTADASLSTVSGDVILDSMGGDLSLNTVSGELTIRNSSGKVGAHSVSGDVTAEGGLRSFSSDSVSGSVFLDTTGIPDQIHVNTVSGGVTLRLEADVPATNTISTVGGKLQLDEAQITGVKGRYTGKFGQLDKHWVDLRVNSVGGDISVLRTVKA
ncbi:MAG TPA: DUF4097 family beta strand repeat-containing protein [Pseudolysinimonas sp.]